MRTSSAKCIASDGKVTGKSSAWSGHGFTETISGILLWATDILPNIYLNFDCRPTFSVPECRIQYCVIYGLGKATLYCNCCQFLYACVKEIKSWFNRSASCLQWGRGALYYRSSYSVHLSLSFPLIPLVQSLLADRIGYKYMKWSITPLFAY